MAALLSLSAGPGRAQSRSLDSVDDGGSGSLDSVDVGQSSTADGDQLSDSDSLDSVDIGESESTGSMQQSYGRSLDSAQQADSRAPDNTNLVWSPTPCSELPTPLVEMPTSSNATLWVNVLDDTRRDIAAAKQQLDEATLAFVKSAHRSAKTQARRGPLGQARDAARADYSNELCKIPVLLEGARQAGVEPGVLRPYEMASE